MQDTLPLSETISFIVYCYFIIVFFGGITLGMLSHFYYYFQGDSINDDRVYQLFILLFLLPMGMVFIIDPNTFTVGRGSSQYLNTLGRQFGWLLVFIGYSTKAKYFIKDAYNRKKVFRYLVILACMTAMLSGGYSFITRNCWGVFESRYIQDSFMWWAELGWCIAGIVGLFAYFRYIRHWDGVKK